MMPSFPLVSFLITLMLAAAVCTQGKEYVRDAAGNYVQTYDEYYIQPVNTKNNGGGLVPAVVKQVPFCPLGINQDLQKGQPGQPVRFIYPYPLMKTPISIMETVIIEFTSKDLPCKEFSGLWEVDESSSASDEPAILIGGEQLGNNSWFRIERAEDVIGANVYKLTTLTGTIGYIPGPWKGAPQLVLTNDTANTLLVIFKKVNDATKAPTSTSRVEKFGLRMFPFY
ncbi:Kunitz family trypsin and protease inhibitor protein [Raphanus sativus]|uniref:Kunitz trypsin inhibitor 2-like n=1 Tax=Raphanus sativus TaxID=3726 RepID=A0A9W3CDD8_RAPSA|nr:kunitz trypsin inhibitor 2-like [Raphanus sativus]KAJ4874938.1 Kunitz family trypsin and protease inhibitor protein [Raphanus sativus]